MSSSRDSAHGALRERREQAIQWLSDLFAQDALDMEEFERRLDRAHQATSVETLDQLVADLSPDDAAPSTAPSAASEAVVPSPGDDSQALVVVRDAADLAASRPGRRRVTAIMSNVARRGQWLVPRDLRVIAVMGGIHLDFREAVMPPGLTEVRLKVVMGGVELIVPPQLAVDTEGFAIMGGFEGVHRASATPDPEVPLLKVTGVVIMGGFEISTRLPGESRRQARRRERRERSQLDKSALK